MWSFGQEYPRPSTIGRYQPDGIGRLVVAHEVRLASDELGFLAQLLCHEEVHVDHRIDVDVVRYGLAIADG